jgi:hypothetical protein
LPEEEEDGIEEEKNEEEEVSDQWSGRSHLARIAAGDVALDTASSFIPSRPDVLLLLYFRDITNF